MTKKQLWIEVNEELDDKVENILTKFSKEMNSEIGYISAYHLGFIDVAQQYLAKLIVEALIEMK